MMSVFWLLISVSALVFHEASPEKLFTGRSSEIKIYSEAPVENIEAVSKQGYGIINIESGEIQFGVMIRSFQFRKSLMKEHFNENYMESGKYPQARFKGRINSRILIEDGADYDVTVTGELSVHGVTVKRSIPGKIRIRNGKLEVFTEFLVNCKDHEIKIPKLVFKNIAENIKVTLKGTFSTA